MTSNTHEIKILHWSPSGSCKAKTMISQDISQLIILVKVNPTHIFSYHEARWDITIRLEDITKPYETLILHKPKLM